MVEHADEEPLVDSVLLKGHQELVLRDAVLPAIDLALQGLSDGHIDLGCNLDHGILHALNIILAADEPHKVTNLDGLRVVAFSDGLNEGIELSFRNCAVALVQESLFEVCFWDGLLLQERLHGSFNFAAHRLLDVDDDGVVALTLVIRLFGLSCCLWWCPLRCLLRLF